MRFLVLALALVACDDAYDRNDRAVEDRTDRAFDVDRPGEVERGGGDVAPGEARDAYPGEHPVVDPDAPSAAPGLEGDENVAPVIEPVGPGEAAGGGAGRAD